jgi:acyl carrier protein
VQSVDELIGAAFSTDGAALTDDDNPETVGGWDSIAHLMMLTSIEEELGVEFSRTR